MWTVGFQVLGRHCQCHRREDHRDVVDCISRVPTQIWSTFILNMCLILRPMCRDRPVHPPYSSVFSTEFNPEYGNTDLLFWLRKRSSPKYGNAHGHLNLFYGNLLLRMWRHLLEMCILLFIMLDARPHAIYLRPRNLY